MSSPAFRTALDWSPLQFGVNGVAANASTNSNTIPIDGLNQVVLDLKLTNATGVAIAVSCYPEIRYHGETNWKQMVTSSTVAGVVTLSVRQIVFPTCAAAAETYSYIYPFSLEGVEGNEFRLRAITDSLAAGGATDLIYVRCRVAHSGV